MKNTGGISPLATSGGDCLSGDKDKPSPKDMSQFQLVMIFIV